jgi:hypothetical protein
MLQTKQVLFAAILKTYDFPTIIFWVSDCCLTPTQQFSALSSRKQANFKWDDGEIRFVLDQHT